MRESNWPTSSQVARPQPTSMSGVRSHDPLLGQGWGQGLSEKWGGVRDSQRSVPLVEMGREGVISWMGQRTVLWG